MNNPDNEDYKSDWIPIFKGLAIMTAVLWLMGEISKPSQAEKDQKAYERYERTLRMHNDGIRRKLAAKRVMEYECGRNPTSMSCADAIIEHDQVYIIRVTRNPYSK